MPRPAGSKNAKTIAREQAKDDALKASGAATVMDFTDEVEPDEDDEADVDGAAELAEQPISNNDLAKALMALTEMQRQNLEGAPIRKVPISKFKTRSPFNPTGAKRKLKSRFYQNGGWVNIDRLTPKEVALFNTLSDLLKTGQTIRVKEMVSFSKVQNGGNIDLHLLYKNKSNDDKLALKSEFRHLVDMLEGGIEVASTPASLRE